MTGGNRILGTSSHMSGDYYAPYFEMGVPYLHWGGMHATRRLLERCALASKQRVLDVGCGSGYSVCWMAKRYGCEVVGLDISPRVVNQAVRCAGVWAPGLDVAFCVADAHTLPFQDGVFDAVITEFVTQFLDVPRALQEYVRVVKCGGVVGMNELSIADSTPADIRRTITDALQTFQHVSGLVLHLYTPSQWREWCHSAGLRDIHMERIAGTYLWRDYAKALGGWYPLIRLRFRMMRRVFIDAKFRHQAVQTARLAYFLFRSRKFRSHVHALLIVGKKQSTRITEKTSREGGV